MAYKVFQGAANNGYVFRFIHLQEPQMANGRLFCWRQPVKHPNFTFSFYVLGTDLLSTFNFNMDNYTDSSEVIYLSIVSVGTPNYSKDDYLQNSGCRVILCGEVPDPSYFRIKDF